MVRIGLSDHQQRYFARRRDGGICRCAILGDYRGTVGLPRVIDKETGVRGKLRMKSQAQQPLLTAEKNFGTDVDEQAGRTCAVSKNLDAAGLFDNKQALAAIMGAGDVVGAGDLAAPAQLAVRARGATHPAIPRTEQGTRQKS
jgi:hypothetical protein